MTKRPRGRPRVYETNGLRQAAYRDRIKKKKKPAKK